MKASSASMVLFVRPSEMIAGNICALRLVPTDFLTGSASAKRKREHPTRTATSFLD